MKLILIEFAITQCFVRGKKENLPRNHGNYTLEKRWLIIQYSTGKQI